MNYRDLSLSLAEALVRSQTAAGPPTAPGAGGRPPLTITISREAGALGSSVAAEVGRRLSWPVYDRNILDRIAEELRRPPSQLEGVDERPASWLGECLSCLLDRYHVASDAYLKYLFTVVRGLGAGGRCVIVGRGANFLLPEETTLRVRLVAREEDRIQVVARRLGLANGDAAAWVGKVERERRAFVRSYFGEDVADPLHYDLVLNMSRLSVEEAAGVITETLRRLETRVGPAEREEPAARTEQPASLALA